MKRAALAKAHRQAAVKQGCVMCKHSPVEPSVRVAYYGMLTKLEAHHILPQRHLKELGVPMEVMHSEANAMGLCAYHHGRHEKWVERVPRELLPSAVYELAEAAQIGWLIDREYAL